MGLSEAQVLARSTELLSPATTASYRSLLERRLAGEPVAYLFGEREFFGRSFRVDRRVLIPRPETEHLIEAALELDLPARATIADIGTGSGAIAITLALEIAEARLLAADLSVAALVLAAVNTRDHSVTDRVELLATDRLAALDAERLDLVVSNPPYIDPAIAGELSPEVTDFEPPMALFAAERGWRLIEGLLSDGARLRPGTPLLLEIGFDQGDRLADRCRRGPIELLEIRPDLAGRDRIALLRRRAGR
jgi:release factor glutamine methyltransferase